MPMLTNANRHYNHNTGEAPDSAVDMSGDATFAADMESATRGVQDGRIVIDYNGIAISCTFDEITKMGAELAKARAEGIFPRTKAASHNIRATIEDYFRLGELTEARGTTPRENWTEQPEVAELQVRIAREIRDRDKIAADESEAVRVQSHVSSMMEGVGAEAKLYNIVQHAVAYAVKSSSADSAATQTVGQNMAELLRGIRGVIKEMGEKGTLAGGAHGVDLEAVLEDVFGMIDFAMDQTLDGRAKRMDGQIKDMDGQIKDMDGQIKDMDGQIKDMDGHIMHLNAIGQHVNAIDGHVHSLGNNLNSMGTLLNSTNGNITAMTAQVALLQTIVNMLPRMIAEVLEQQLPGIVDASTKPIIAALEAHYGISLTRFPGTQKKNKVKKFFKSIFSGLKKIFK
ncbi:uncharacterized protein F4822DRAFT_443397 [Hypoxylon trugodes]|uniref:uncharacterized protein n=1 Tax=Hypoxylon trugodes TaxID=326681 RepID=UPI00218DFC1B|nr:uncharacterized protein F4822DRAFT_443397 [Hypoxylon trugodes]KAI1388365.1 hypothetical protein F4822DRAFT_443397 [Hypoxylon trugodes]